MRPEAQVAGLLIQVAELERRLEMARQDVDRVERERAWWEARWRQELAARYRVLREGIERGVYLGVEA